MRLESEVLVKGVDGGEHVVVRGVFDGDLRDVHVDVFPYGFITWSDVVRSGVSADYCDLRSADSGERVGKVSFMSPKEVGVFARKFGKTYEMDVPYVRRLLVDKVFDVGYGGRVAYIDVECCRVGGSWSVTAVSIGDGREIKTFVGGDERSLLSDVLAFMKSRRLSVLVGWNVKYDYNVVLERSKALGVDWSWLKFVHPYDLRTVYMDRVKGLSRYTLDEVSRFEGVTRKLAVHDVCALSESELVEYNRTDVQILHDLEGKYRFVEVDCVLAERVGLLLSMLSPFKIGDTLVLRRCRQLGYVSPTARHVGNVEKYSGAFVIEPKPGRYTNVVYLDVKSMYPSIIMNEGIDVGRFGGRCVPFLIREFVRLKEEAESRSDYVSKEVYKRLANSMYGLFGFEGFRYYDRRKAEAVTSKGREIISTIAELLRELGHEVVYGDTDSIFYVDPDFSSVSWIADYVNNVLRCYRVDVEMLFEQFLLFKSESGGGAKKRYAGLDVNGKLFVRGVELRRRDWCELSKEVLFSVIRMLFDGRTYEEIMDEVSRIREALFRGEYDDKLVIRKEVKGVYKVSVPHLRAWRKAVELGLISPDVKEVEYVWGVNDVEPYRKGVKINYMYYWERQILPPVRRVLTCVGGGGLSKYIVKPFVGGGVK